MTPETAQFLHLRVKQLNALPAMPIVLRSLSECLAENQEKVNVEEIVRLISYDESLAAQCLRLANSPLFHRRVRVASIQEAVFALGLSRVRDLVYSCCLPALFADVKAGMPPVTFWRHALGTAFVSQHLAQSLHMENPEKMYLAGLLHDVGILVNCLLFPDDFREVLRIATTSETPLVEIEKPLLGFTHCESGRILADLWALPEDLSGAIEYHHVATTDVGDPMMTATVNLADLLCRLRGLGYGYYEARELDLAALPAWKVLTEKCPAIAQLDLANFTFSLDAQAVAVRALVDNILGVASASA